MVYRPSYVFQDEDKYYHHLTNKLYKILPLFEEKNEYLYKHIQTTIFELEGAEHVFVECDGHRVEYFDILETLYKLNDLLSPPLSEKISHDLIKTQVFKCTGLVKRLYEGIDDES